MEKTRYTLLELSRMIGKTMEESFPGKYWLVSEINEIRENINGHCYLELIEKDSSQDRITARSRATIWAGTWRMIRSYFETSTSRSLEKGMMILVEVNVVFHELYGLSLNIRDIDPVYTMGDLERKRAETIRRLEQEGIINMNKELPFPVLPSRIAVVSSPHAAGYEDFLHQITNNPRRYRFGITLFPALMQGDNTVRSVTEALEAIFEMEHQFDLVVILRGGGSASDLNSFDNYEIASHIAQLPLPVITGIGHERDRTIAGLVANTDLKTPTAVAEFLIGKFQEQDMRITGLSSQLAAEVTRILDHKKQFIRDSIRELPKVTANNIRQKKQFIRSAGTILAGTATRFIQKNRHKLASSHSGFGFIVKNYLLTENNLVRDLRTKLIPGRTKEYLRNKSGRLELLDKMLTLVDPQNILKKGYALVHKEGRIVKGISEVGNDDILVTRLHDGRFRSRVISDEAEKRVM